MLRFLVGCIRLQEGDYDFDYDAVDVDTCDIFGGGQIAEDTRGELSWEEETLVFEFDGTDDDLEFEVDGTELFRASEGRQYLNEVCWLATEQDDVGEMLSNTAFSGHTEWVGTLEGDCGVFEAWVEDPCYVEFDWSGAFDD